VIHSFFSGSVWEGKRPVTVGGTDSTPVGR
jgi:hypothetical protein